MTDTGHAGARGAVNRHRALPLAVLLALAAACQDALDPPAEGPVATITITPEHVTAPSGETVQFAATLEDQHGHVLTGRSIAWNTSNTAVATVDETGRALVVGAGKATITATAEGHVGSATVVEGHPLVFTSLSLGTFHSCGLTADGIALCWGQNTEGQLGEGSTTVRNVPVPVAGGIRFASISARGVSHTCGLDQTGQVWCWGRNTEGFLGDGTLVSSPVPVPVAGGHTFVQLAVERTHSCGVTASGAAYCWGENAHGELGDGTTDASNVPVPVAGGIAFASLQPGRNHTCGLTASGAAYCWGINEHGQLGDGTQQQRITPAPAAAGMAFTALTVRDKHACGIAVGGGGYCWGYNIDGQLGDGSVVDRFLPVAITRGNTLTVVNAGSYHTCGLAAGGSAWCWGENVTGPLGDGTTTNSSVPVAVESGRTFAFISAGCFHTCGVTTAGETFCWGRNAEGQLGTGDYLDATTPVRVFQSP